MKDKANILERFKYPLLVLTLGLILMLLPSGEADLAPSDQSRLMAQALSSTQGVGQAQVLISEHGAVVVCTGAEDAKVRLDIIRAVGSYTGLSSDKITIMKMSDQSKGE